MIEVLLWCGLALSFALNAYNLAYTIRVTRETRALLLARYKRKGPADAE